MRPMQGGGSPLSAGHSTANYFIHSEMPIFPEFYFSEVGMHLTVDAGLNLIHKYSISE